MITEASFRKMALSFPEAIEQDHFGKPSFRVKKKIFATYSPIEKRAVLKLNSLDQSVFCAFDKSIIYPVQGGWGRQGYTIFELKTIRKAMLLDALTLAYSGIALAKLKPPAKKRAG